VVAIEPDVADNQGLLHPKEVSFIRWTAAYDDSNPATDYKERLNLGLDRC